MLAIETRSVSKAFRRLKAVDQVDLQIRRGEIFGLLGPNGSGKTTLIRMLAGILKPTEGEVSVLGKPASDKSAKADVGYMTQENALYEDLSVRQNIAFFASMCGANIAFNIERVLDLVDLRDRQHSRVHELSGGMIRRTSLACALVHSPNLLLLDEPTVGVDPALRVTFWEFFRRSVSAGTTILVSSHVMDEAIRCDRLGFIHNGKIVAVGTPTELANMAGSQSLEEAFISLTTQETIES